MKKKHQLIVVGGFMLLLNSCGIISKTRYGNGLKLHLGENWARSESKALCPPKLEKQKRRIRFIPEENSQAYVSVMQSDSCLQKQAFEKPVLTDAYINRYKHIKSQAGKFDLENSVNAKPIPSNMAAKQTGSEMIGLKEPHVIPAALSFYSAFFMILLFPMPKLLLLACLLMLTAGFVLAKIARSNIKQNPGTFKGNGLAFSIVIIVRIMAVLMLIYVISALAIIMFFL